MTVFGNPRQDGRGTPQRVVMFADRRDQTGNAPSTANSMQFCAPEMSPVALAG
jgi:hypothetical protein